MRQQHNTMVMRNVEYTPRNTPRLLKPRQCSKHILSALSTPGMTMNASTTIAVDVSG